MADRQEQGIARNGEAQGQRVGTQHSWDSSPRKAALQGLATPTLLPALRCGNPRHRVSVGNRAGERKVRAINPNVEKKCKDSGRGITGRLVVNTCSCKGFLSNSHKRQKPGLNSG